ncbi:LysR family transcriptional regulator [Dyella japonica]|uniref:LysR family transcriptional regulator n=1 Tax=Dyella japonica A8 TaxID=1217721 RepID=A0A075K539_9GAMM|nr:LysR family transcriptional regulator [Dyella japonica]AIF48807.1 LysR family transcriptional regulator [Dyella japonica A8]
MELLNDMALFVEVVKARGFRGAAEATGVPNSTLSRRIGALEKAIGLRLLHRTTRKVELTEAGQVYFERCKRIVDEARLAHEQLGDMLAQPSGVLRVSMPVDFATIYMAPLIAEFAAKYPGITFDFDVTPRQVDLVREPYDVAIRMGEPESSNLIARPLASLSTRLFASPRYLERAGTPVEPQELEAHECLNILKASTWMLHRKTESIQVATRSRFTINSVGLIRSLAAQGMGILLVPEKVVVDDLATGRLVPVLPAWRGQSTSVHALTETRLLPAKTQRFIEFFKERLAHV